MPSPVLAAALEREHREIDSEISTFIEKLECGSVQREPLTAALEALRRRISYPHADTDLPPQTRELRFIADPRTKVTPQQRVTPLT